MPVFRIDEVAINVSRDALLLDTNVLVAAFLPNEEQSRKDYALFVLEEYDRPLLVPSVVVVEAWGVLVGRNKELGAGYALLTWLNSPSSGATLVPPPRGDVIRTQQLVESKRIDCVDAMLAEMATQITVFCGLNPFLEIATFDTSDFLKMTVRDGVQLRVFDMRTLDTVELG